MIADSRASRRGDLITIIVDESSSVSSSVRTTSDKSGSVNNSVERWLFSTAASGFGTHKGELPATSMQGNNEYSGGGTITTRNTLSGRVTVQVVDALPNGNLIIEGHREIASSGERQFMVLMGIVATRDVTADNTVLSSRIANAKIEYMSEGAITDAQKKGWLTQINDLINPL